VGVSVAVVGGTISDGAAKSHFIVVQTSCLHKIWLQAGRLHYNIWIITVLFSLFAASSFLDPWCEKKMRSRIEPTKKVARMVRNHWDLLVNW